MSPEAGETETFLMPEVWAGISRTSAPSRMSNTRTQPSSQPSTAWKCSGSMAQVSVSFSNGPQRRQQLAGSRSHTRSVLSSPEE